jgi:hypothetical protein
MATAAITSFASGLASASLSGARPLRRHVGVFATAPLGGVSLNLAQTTSRRELDIYPTSFSLLSFPAKIHHPVDLILSILGQRISQNVSVKAAGEEVSTELPEVVKKLQDTVRFFYCNLAFFFVGVKVQSVF